MERDSLGSLSIPLGYLGKLVTSSPAQEFREQVGEQITPKQLTAEMARLNAAFGPPKDRTPEQVRVMTNEWYRALQGFGHKTVKLAIDKVVLTWVPSFGRTWPSIAEVHAICQKEETEWADVKGITGRRYPGLEDWTGRGDAPKPFEIQSPEQIAARKAAAVARMKAAYKGAFEEQSWTDRFEQWTPASQDMTVSDALRNSCAAKRARGEPTCEPACQRRPEGCRYAKSQDHQP